MAHDHGREPARRDVDERRRPLAEPETAALTGQPPLGGRMGAEAVQSLQRAYGNQVVQRMLAPRGEASTALVQRNRGAFTFGHKAPERAAVEDQDELNQAVEWVLEEYWDGPRQLFLKNDQAKSVTAWRDLLYTYMQDSYDLTDFDRGDVLTAVHWLKDKYREEVLLHMTDNLISWSGHEAPYSVEDLKEKLEGAGAYLDADDKEALEALFESEGKFARKKVPLEPGHKELSDEDSIVVWMDDHQQKHQRDKIPGFKAYIGEPGDKFATGKDLQWHIDNTVPVVRQSIAEAIEAQLVTPTTTYSPSKEAINGIKYDLTITYDDPTGKYVGSYHCNPVVDEDE
jgi:hypothetical protein